MNELHRQGVFQQRHARSVAGEDLEVLGKQASACWYETRETGCGPKTLGEAVVETVKSAGLSPEQVRRVVEFANTDAFLREFHKLSSGHKYVDFGQGVLANPSEVLRDLNDGGGGTVFDAGTGDYDAPPAEKQSSVGFGGWDTSDGAVAGMFGTEGESVPFEEPLRPFWDARDKIAGMHSHISSELSAMEIAYEDISLQLEHHTKQAALAGASLGQVVQAWSAVTDNPVFIKAAFQKITPSLVENEVFHSYDELGASLQKVGSARLVNPQHPLVTSFSDYCDALTKVAELRYQQQGLGENLVELEQLLKEGNVGKLREFAGRAAKAVSEAGNKAGDVVGKLTGSEAAGTAARVGTKVAPIAAGGLGAKILADQVATSYPLQASLPYMPGSQQYRARLTRRNQENNPEYRAMMAAQGMPMGGLF